MHLGIFAKTFSRPTLAATFDAVCAHGLRYVQLNMACVGLPSMPEQISQEVRDAIRQSAVEHGITIAAVSGTFNMIHPDPKERRQGLRRLNILAAACDDIGTSLITLCTGTRDAHDMWRHHPDNDRHEAWQDLLVSLGEALNIAEDHQVTLAFEPEITNVINSAIKARRLLDEVGSPRLQVVLDAANLFHPGNIDQMNSVLQEAFDLLGPDIVIAHAKDLRVDQQVQHVAAGTGVLDYDRYLALLQSISFEGPLILHGLGEHQVSSSVSFLRAKITSMTRSIRRGRH